jgi:amidohydrolase
MQAPWIGAAVARLADEMIDTRRWLHRRPELSLEEHEATALIRERLRAAGLRELRCPTPTGALALLEGGRPGRTVLLRADIDALPVQEETALDFRSQVPERMHACGHDAHAAIGLAVAGSLAQRAEDLPGRFVFLFQPAEEIAQGARRILDGGALDGLGIDAAVACHVAAPLPVGRVGLRAGIAMAAIHDVTVRIRGTGGHGSQAQRQGNVVLAAGHLAGLLPATVGEMSYEGARCACSTGMIHVGTAPNVIPRSALLRGTLRTFTPEHARAALAALREACDRTAAEFGVEVELSTPLVAPAVFNDAAIASEVRSAIATEVGAASLLEMPPVSASDDMSEIQARFPGCYFFVGAGDPANPGGAHHSPDFRIDERCLPLAARSMLAAALALAAPPG